MLSRRSSLVLPWLVAACGGGEERDFPPLHYNYLTPLRLNVAAIQIEQRFVPTGSPPDVGQLDPMPPVQALRNMAADRLQALGAAGQGVFVILQASLIRVNNTITANFAVELNIYTSPNVRAGYANASVTGSYTGDVDDLPGKLYDMTKSFMDRMNVEFEYQVRRSLGGWLLSGAAPPPQVQQQPLTSPGMPRP
jgi:hypothetical protein